MRYTENPHEVTLFFHVLESEIDQASKAMGERGIKKDDTPEVWFKALLEELDKLIPSAGLVAKSETEYLWIAVMRKGQSLPDNRAQRPSRHEAAQVQQSAPQGQPDAAAPPRVTAVALWRLPATSPLRQRMAEVQMQPLPAEQVEADRTAPDRGELPFPTHSGVLRLDTGTELRVYQLSSGERVVDLEDLSDFMNSAFGGQAPAP